MSNTDVLNQINPNFEKWRLERGTDYINGILLRRDTQQMIEFIYLSHAPEAVAAAILFGVFLAKTEDAGD